VQNNISKRKVVAIVGAGFGGLNAAINLRRSQVDVILVDRNNYHLFQPLLYQVATAGLAPEEIAYPVRSIFRSHSNATFRLAEVTGIDLDGKCLHTSNGVIPYDFLILSVGGETNFFGLKNVQKNGFELKDLDDAESIRGHILRMFEMASFETDEELRQAMRTFVVVGGGPTGVECVGALSELVRLVLVKDFPKLKATDVRIILMEMMDHLLPGFPDQLSEAAIRTLKRKKVEVRLSTTVNDFDGEQVTLESGEVIRTKTLVWAAGVRAASIIDKSGLKTAKQNRVVVEPTLQAPENPEVFVIGDAAYLEHDGAPLPMVAPVAIQQARTAAKNINNLLSNKPLEEFVYKDPGSLATIGRNNAVARVGRFKFHGFIAWLIWLAVHLFWLIGFRNRMVVLINWAWDYFLYERAVRLITPSPKR
jgi:NADH:ubiquinone reductase (H+-translocating)